MLDVASFGASALLRGKKRAFVDLRAARQGTTTTTRHDQQRCAQREPASSSMLAGTVRRPLEQTKAAPARAAS
jgi:hypothetical protein